MSNEKDMDFKSYEQMKGLLTSNTAMEEKLDFIAAEARQIFETEEDGKLLFVNRGKYKNVPLMKKLWIVTHLRRVIAFLAAILHFIDSLNLTDVPESTPVNQQEDDDTQDGRANEQFNESDD